MVLSYLFLVFDSNFCFRGWDSLLSLKNDSVTVHWVEPVAARLEEHVVVRSEEYFPEEHFQAVQGVVLRATAGEYSLPVSGGRDGMCRR